LDRVLRLLAVLAGKLNKKTFTIEIGEKKLARGNTGWRTRANRMLSHRVGSLTPVASILTAGKGRRELAWVIGLFSIISGVAGWTDAHRL